MNRSATIATIFGLVMLCINPGYTQGAEHINLLLCSVLCLSPFALLLKGTRVIIPRIDIPLGIVCVLVMCTPLIFHSETIRWSTMLFTCAYCVFFMMLARLVRIADIRPSLYCRIIEWIIYAFATVLIVQQICVLAGWKVFNASMIYYDAPFKLNSLTAEPSHTTVTLCTLFYFYNQTKRAINPAFTLTQSISGQPCLWIAWTWTIFSTVNTSAYVLAPIAMLPYLTVRNAKWVAVALIVIIIGFITIPKGYFIHLDRLRDTAVALTTLDDKKMDDADPSSAARIVPTLRGYRALHLADEETWIGHGVDADQRDTEPRPCDGKNRGFAGIFSMTYNYGLPCALVFWWLIGSVTLIRRKWLSIITFLFAIQMSAEYNMQLIWMILAFSMTMKYDVFNSRNMLGTVNKKIFHEKSGICQR